MKSLPEILKSDVSYFSFKMEDILLVIQTMVKIVIQKNFNFTLFTAVNVSMFFLLSFKSCSVRCVDSVHFYVPARFAAGVFAGISAASRGSRLFLWEEMFEVVSRGRQPVTGLCAKRAVRADVSGPHSP